MHETNDMKKKSSFIKVFCVGIYHLCTFITRSSQPELNVNIIIAIVLNI